MKRSDITDCMVCEAYRDKATLPGRPFADSVLADRTGAPWKVVNAAMNRALYRGLLEYGVSLRSGWLTPDGEALLAATSSETTYETARDQA